MIESEMGTKNESNRLDLLRVLIEFSQRHRPSATSCNASWRPSRVATRRPRLSCRGKKLNCRRNVPVPLAFRQQYHLWRRPWFAQSESGRSSMRPALAFESSWGTARVTRSRRSKLSRRRCTRRKKTLNLLPGARMKRQSRWSVTWRKRWRKQPRHRRRWWRPHGWLTRGSPSSKKYL